LPANSVGTQQLQNRAVTATKLASDAATGSKVKDGSLLGPHARGRMVPERDRHQRHDEGEADERCRWSQEDDRGERCHRL